MTGLRWVFEKIVPPKPDPQRRPPSSLILFLVWLSVTYVAIYGAAVQVYKVSMDEAIKEGEHLIFLMAVSDPENRKNFINKIPVLQNKTNLVKPTFFNPHSVFISFSTEEACRPLRQLLVQSLENWKTELHSQSDDGSKTKRVRLDGLKAQNAQMEFANFENGSCQNCDFRGANFRGANLRGVNFWGSLMTNVQLEEADLNSAKLGWVDLSFSTIGETGFGYSGDLISLKDRFKVYDIEHANIYEVNAPEWLKDKLEKQGAQALDPEAWEKYKKANNYEGLKEALDLKDP